MTVRGGGVPCHAMAFVPPLRMGPPPRSLAADAHVCIMVRITVIHRIQGCGASPSCPTASSPRTRHPDHAKRVDVLRAVKARPGNVGVRGKSRATAGPDSPCARRLPTCVGRGEETGFQVEQRN